MRFIDPCPCGSKKAAKSCCYAFGSEPRPPQDARTKPPGPKTGYANPKCYARDLDDCCTKITGEHFVSKKILERIQGDGLVLASGLTFLEPGQARPISAASLAANVLCKRHNQALSGLDQVMLTMFTCLSDFAREFRTEGSAASDRVVLLNGHDIERWCLKLLCGAACSGMVQLRGIAPKVWLPPRQWLDVLFDEERIRRPQGLYFVSEANATFVPADAVSLVPLTSNDAPAGVRLGLSGFNFVFAGAELRPAQGTHRLHDLRVRSAAGVEKVVAMRWRPGEAEPTNVVVAWSTP